MNNTPATKRNGTNTNRDGYIVAAARNVLGSAGVLSCMLLISGCDDEEVKTANGNIDVIDKRSGTLLSGELEAINGTYGANCLNRSGSWSVPIQVGATLDHAELSVIVDDTDCVLTLTEVQTSMAGDLAADPPIVLATSFAADPSEFDDPVDFYANASVDSLAFADDFVITLLYSDDPSLLEDDGNAEFEVVETSVSAQSVQAPEYSIDTSGLTILVDDDQEVQSATGSMPLSLAMGAVAGQSYMVLAQSGLDTFAELDAAWNAGAPSAIGASVPAADFSLVGQDLDNPTIRTLIIANISEGVAAYQAFEITFHPAM